MIILKKLLLNHLNRSSLWLVILL